MAEGNPISALAANHAFQTAMPLVRPTDANLADEFYRRLVEWINDFHRALDNELEVGARLVSFGQTQTFRIEDIGYWNPSLIKFYGTNDQGEKVELIQHVTQINVLLVAMRRADITIPKKPIGFASWDEFDHSTKSIADE